MKQNKMREEMKDAFINALKEEQIPWQCDWSRTGRPENAVTGRPYRGVNSVWLSYVQGEKGYRDPRWCTFKQAQEKGWKVKKGEKGTRVEFWSLYDTETKQKISNRQAADLKEQLGDDFYGRVNQYPAYIPYLMQSRSKASRNGRQKKRSRSCRKRCWQKNGTFS